MSSIRTGTGHSLRLPDVERPCLNISKFSLGKNCLKPIAAKNNSDSLSSFQFFRPKTVLKIGKIFFAFRRGKRQAASFIQLIAVRWSAFRHSSRGEALPACGKKAGYAENCGTIAHSRDGKVRSPELTHYLRPPRTMQRGLDDCP